MQKFMGDSHIKSPSCSGKRKRISSSGGRSDADIGLGSKKTSSGKRRDKIRVEIYRQKLQEAISDGKLSDEDVNFMERLQIMLCIPKQTVETVHAEICGVLFENVVKEAIAGGVELYDSEVKKSVRKAAYGLHLTKEAALSIASKEVRKMLIKYVQQARAAENRTDSAKILKELISFNSLIVTRLVQDIKGEEESSSKSPHEKHPMNDEDEENLQHEEEEWDSLQSLPKLRKGIQTETTLNGDLPDMDRTELYKTYLKYCLSYCLSGDITMIPFGGQITTEREIISVHRGLRKEAGIDINTMISVSLRENLFQKTVGDIFSSVIGEFGEAEVYENVPAVALLRKRKQKGVHLFTRLNLILRTSEEEKQKT
ncbi:unnamed protein product [Cuscuta campestris]|uniref:Uncharacterized protein n=1 Tax=Cuscuta campestris TaxID=132261 RepID=A0A484NJX8_9ASTE|nr:unnamed protein product [Cuscuta campestris]